MRYLLPALALWAAAAASGLVAVLGAATGARRKRLAGTAVGRHARRGGRQHRRVLPGLDRLDRLAVPAGLHDGDRFQHRLGPGFATPCGRGARARIRGWLDFGPRGISTADILGAQPLLGTAAAHVDGWAAVSVTALNSANRSSLSWLRAWCPVGILDGTILVYHFSQPPASTSGQEPPPRSGSTVPGAVEFGPPEPGSPNPAARCCRAGTNGTTSGVRTSQVLTAKTMPPMTSVT